MPRLKRLKSKGHLLFRDRWEYFELEGQVYRAPIDAPIRTDIPVRNGARWEASKAHFAATKEKGLYPFSPGDAGRLF